MKAWRLNGNGIATLQLVDAAPAEPGRGEVRIKMHAAALNYRDLGVAAGQYPSCPGLIPLSDGAGVIDAVGENVSDFAIGDAVVSCFYENWQAGRATAANHRLSLGCERDGVLAEQIVLPVSAIVPKPGSLSFREAATLPCAALTAWSALFSEARLEPGQQVLVQGTGGVAMFALQFAKLAGACVTVLSGSDEKLRRAAALGADHGINYCSNPQWSNAVLELTGGVGVDVVVELGGAETLAQSLKCIRHDGMIAVIGVLSGLESRIFLLDILFRHSRLHGVTVGHRDDFLAMNRAIDTHGLKPVIDSHCAFDAARDAYAALPRGEHFGKIVIDCV